VIVGEIDNATRAGLLTIQGGAKLTVKDEGILAVTAASHVIVNKTFDATDEDAESNALADSGLSLHKGANVIAVVANTLGTTQALIALVEEGENAGNTLVAIETGAPAIIDAGAVFEEITTSGATGGSGELTTVDVANELAEIATASPARSTGSAGDALSFLNTESNDITTVIYTGPTALGAIDATGKALIIAGTITNQAQSIAVKTLEIAEGGKLTTTSTITADTVTNNGELNAGAGITATGGTVENNGTLSASAGISAATVENTDRLILSGGTSQVDEALINNGPLTINGSGTTLDLGENGTITGDGTITNNGIIKTAVTGAGSGATLNTILAKAGGKIEARGTAISVASQTELTVPKGATLTLDASAGLTLASGVTPGKITVASEGELDLSALVGGSVTLSGSGSQIEVSGTLKLPAPNASNYQVAQINYGSSAIKINAGGKVYMVSTDDPPSPPAEDYYIGPSDAKYTWDNPTNPVSSVEFKKDGEMALTGNLTSAADYNQIGTKVTINRDSILTVEHELAVKETGSLVIDGTVKVANEGTLDLAVLTASDSITLNDTIEVESGGKLITPEQGYPEAISYDQSGNIKLKHGSSFSVGANYLYIGDGGVYTWTDSQPNSSAEQYVLLTQNGETRLHGNLTSSKAQYITAVATLDNGWTLTMKPVVSSMLWITESGHLFVEGTIKIEDDSEATKVGWIELANTASKLTLMPNGTLDFPANSGIYTDSINYPNGANVFKPRMSVYTSDGEAVDTTPQIVTDEDATDKSWKFKATGTTGGTADSITVTLGRVQFSLTGNVPVNKTEGSKAVPFTEGKLTAGENTAIVFEGAQ
jgi:hypothetical protein